MTSSTGAERSRVAGFTLIEMMIVVGIILLISSVVVWNFASQVKPQRVRSAAATIVSMLDICRSEAMRQQVYPYLLTGSLSPDEVAGISEQPRYWAFSIHFHTWQEGDEQRMGITVIAMDDAAAGRGNIPPGDHSRDLVPMVEIPSGVKLYKGSGAMERQWLQESHFPVFLRDLSPGAKFVKGDPVDGPNPDILVRDETDPELAMRISIDPIFGGVKLSDGLVVGGAPISPPGLGLLPAAFRTIQ